MAAASSSSFVFFFSARARACVCVCARIPQQGDYVLVRGTVTHFSHEIARPPWYDSCPNAVRSTAKGRGGFGTGASGGGETGGSAGGGGGSDAPLRECMKKALRDDATGGWQDCQACRQRIARPVARYALSILITDASGGTYASAFGEQAEQLLGGTRADDLKGMIERQQHTEYDAVFARHLFGSFLFKLQVKRDDYVSDNGGFSGGGFASEPRARCQVVSVTPLRYAAQAQHTLGDLDALLLARS